MPTKSEQRAAFLAKHPWCVFCGGASPATTVEHCPPKAMFVSKAWPETFEFPACAACNAGTKDQDAVIAMLARIHADESGGDADKRLDGLMRNVNTQFPDAVRRMMPSHIEARRRNRALGIRPGPGQLHQDVAPVSVPVEFNDAVKTFALKLSKAIYFRESNLAFPNTGMLTLHWFTNVELLRQTRYPIFERMASLPGKSPQLVRGGRFLNDQFEFKFTFSDDRQVFVLQARIGQSFGLVVYGSLAPRILEAAIAGLEAKYGRQGPLQVLQHPSAT